MHDLIKDLFQGACVGLLISMLIPNASLGRRILAIVVLVLALKLAAN